MKREKRRKKENNIQNKKKVTNLTKRVSKRFRRKHIEEVIQILVVIYDKFNT